MFEDLEKLPFLSEYRGPAIKNEVVASATQAFFEESQADMATPYEMLRALDLHGLQLELVAFNALQDKSCVVPHQAPTPS